MGEGSNQSGAGAEHAFFLKYWAQTRGPLFERTRMAVVRAVVCGELMTLSRGAEERRVRLSASRTLQAHRGPEKASKHPASEEALEAASRGCSDIRRIRRECTSLPYWQQTDRIVEALRKMESQDERDRYDQVMDYCWAEMICGVLFAPEPEVRLRAARTLLCWTEPDARKLGYGKPEELDDEAKETIEQLRVSRQAPSPPVWNPPTDYAPEIQARGRDSP